MKGKKHPRQGRPRKSKSPIKPRPVPEPVKAGPKKTAKILEIVLKCDSVGSMEAVMTALTTGKGPEGMIRIVRAGVGPVAKSDLLMALTASRLVVGFNVDVMPNLQQLCREQQTEVRLHNVIYRLVKDLHEIAGSLNVQEAAAETVLAKAKVIALFKSSRRGVIIGCEVLQGTLEMGQPFRLISAMGPVYTGRIESLHIERDEVPSAGPGKQVGIKISDFSRAKVGDLVESFRVDVVKRARPWQPGGRILRFEE